MREHTILQIRESIELATAREAQTHELKSFLRSSLPRLHKLIDLPAEDPSTALLDFVMRYIQQVPDVLETLNCVLKDTGAFETCKVFIGIAEEFFLKPPEIARQHSGLQALIDEAYLTHRLIEEVNDRVTMLSGAPLVPVDMTLANIVVHDLLGEQFANQLDLAVHFAIETLFDSDDVGARQWAQLAEPAANRAWARLFERWPDIASQGDVRVNLPSDQVRGPLH